MFLENYGIVARRFVLVFSVESSDCMRNFLSPECDARWLNRALVTLLRLLDLWSDLNDLPVADSTSGAATVWFADI